MGPIGIERPQSWVEGLRIVSLAVVLFLANVRNFLHAVAPSSRPRPIVSPDDPVPLVVAQHTPRQQRVRWGVAYAGGMAGMAALWSVVLLRSLGAPLQPLSFVLLVLPTPMWPGPFLHLALLFRRAEPLGPAQQRWQVSVLVAVPALLWILAAGLRGGG